jgi:hypothetical protein
VGAEPLSGLARAFIYAGGKSLVVSHWAVSDEATAKLMSNLFEISKNKPDLSHGEMLRQATLNLLDSATTDEEADPRVWGPFVVVGEPARPKWLPAALSPPAAPPAEASAPPLVGRWSGLLTRPGGTIESYEAVISLDETGAGRIRLSDPPMRRRPFARGSDRSPPYTAGLARCEGRVRLRDDLSDPGSGAAFLKRARVEHVRHDAAHSCGDTDRSART